MSAILTIDGLTKRFGGLLAIDALSCAVEERSIMAIIGPNGAGKTTLFNLLTGYVKPSSGRVVFAGEVISGRRPDQITHQGVARTFQNIRLFGTMTATENVMVAQHARMRGSMVGSVLRTRRVRDEELRVRERARAELAYVGLGPERQDQLAVNLSYGDQRRVEIARALASDPRLLLLDEPTAGMDPNESARLAELLQALRAERDLTIVLIEHDMNVVMGISEQVVVVDHGVKIAEGTPAEVRRDERVIEAYLGVPAEIGAQVA
jgi:branched-chain amino acid transport system ATP-binding protein